MNKIENIAVNTCEVSKQKAVASFMISLTGQALYRILVLKIKKKNTKVKVRENCRRRFKNVGEIVYFMNLADLLPFTPSTVVTLLYAIMAEVCPPQLKDLSSHSEETYQDPSPNKRFSESQRSTLNAIFRNGMTGVAKEHGVLIAQVAVESKLNTSQVKVW